MDQTMEGKIAVVTGASRGIGKAIAVKLASKGATVVINYNGSRERAEEVKNEVESATIFLICSNMFLFSFSYLFLLFFTIPEYLRPR